MPPLKMNFIDGIEPSGQPVQFTFEGRPCTGHQGESIASALLRAGIIGLRKTKSGDHVRGYYCGMGVCWECAVQVGGLGTVRSCSTPVAEGQVICLGDKDVPR